MIRSHRMLVWYAIAGYRRWLSPYKGFRCAAATLHGGDSCSRAVQSIVLQQGPWRGRQAIRDRFALCRRSAQQLRDRRAANAEQDETKKSDAASRGCRRRVGECWIIDIVTGCAAPFMCGAAVPGVPAGGSSGGGGVGGSGSGPEDPTGGAADALGAGAESLGGAGEASAGACGDVGGDACGSMPDCSLPDCSCGG